MQYPADVNTWFSVNDADCPFLGNSLVNSDSPVFSAYLGGDVALNSVMTSKILGIKTSVLSDQTTLGVKGTTVSGQAVI